MTARPALLGTLLLLGACATSPLYVGNNAARVAGTGGEIPRDGQGEPIWAAIPPVPVIATPPPGLKVNPGVPVTGAPGAAPL